MSSASLEVSSECSSISNSITHTPHPPALPIVSQAFNTLSRQQISVSDRQSKQFLFFRTSHKFCSTDEIRQRAKAKAQEMAKAQELPKAMTVPSGRVICVFDNGIA